MTKKKKLKIPEGACPYCLVVHPPQDFIPPEIPENPNIILVGEAPGEEERKYAHDFPEKASPFIGKSGRLLRKILRDTEARPIILNSRQCYGIDKPNLDQIKNNRELFLFPILETYPNLPVVALGAYAASYMAGGKRSDVSLANEVYELFNRIVTFTYHPAYYFYQKRDERILEHIQITIEAALRSNDAPKYLRGKLPANLSEIVIDVETTSARFPWYNSKPIVLGFQPVGFIPYLVRPTDLSADDKARLAKDAKLVIGHNILYDLIHLDALGIRFPNARFHDTLIYHKNLHPNELFNDLKFLAKKYGNFPHWEGWFRSRLQAKEDLSLIDYNKLCNYNARDLYATEALWKEQTQRYNPFTLEMDYLAYIFRLIKNGMKVDLQKLDSLLQKTSAELFEVEKSVREEFSLGEDFNFNSQPQIINFLHKFVPRLPDTQEATLQDYQDEAPAIKRILQIRNLNKLKGTSLEGLKEYIDSDALVHSSVAVHGAETGRSSSSSPNLQNTDPRVRPVFISRFPDGRLLYSDLSGLEYRVIAHLSRERRLISGFKNGLDIHTAAFNFVFERDSKGKADRQIGKTCNYAGVYGCGLDKFLTITGLEYAEGQRAFNRISNLYPEINQWKEDTIRELRRTGWIRSLFGRRRYFGEHITPRDEREAINWIVQSSGHDILKVYLMEATDIVGERGLLISEVHDSFTFDCPSEHTDNIFVDIFRLATTGLTKLIEETFGVQMRVPIIAEVELLKEWK